MSDHPLECWTPGCNGDPRYAAPGRGHVSGCEWPVRPPAVAADEAYDRLHGADGHVQDRWPRGRLVAHPKPGKFWVQVQHRDDISSDWIEVEAPPEIERLSSERDRYRTAWKSAATRAGLATDRAEKAEADLGMALVMHRVQLERANGWQDRAEALARGLS